MEKYNLTPVLIFTVFSICFGSSMLYGYNLSVLNLTSDYIQCFINTTVLSVPCKGHLIEKGKTEEVKKSKMDASFIFGMVIAVFVVTGAIGAGCTSLIADHFGRRNGLLFNSIFLILGGAIAFPTTAVKSVVPLFIGRSIIGFGCGVLIGLACMYLTEIAPMKVRGAIGACNQLAITIGIMVGNIITFDSVLGTPGSWAYAQGLTLVPAVIGSICLFFCPESPRFLYMNKNDEKEARKAIERFSPTEDVEALISEMKAEVDAMRGETGQSNVTFKSLFTTKDLRVPLLIACLLQVMQQLSGVNAIVSYSNILLQTAGVQAEHRQYAVFGLGAWNVFLTVIGLPLLEKTGRRTLILISGMGVMASLLMVMITIVATNPNDPTQKTLPIISVVGCYLFMAAFAIGLGTVPAMVVAELTRQDARAKVYAVTQALQWTSNLCVVATYPSLNKFIGGWVFLIFLAIVTLCWVFFFFYMPETKNRTFDEIARQLGSMQIGKHNPAGPGPPKAKAQAPVGTPAPLPETQDDNENACPDPSAQPI